jgi:hypothetical protein
MAVLPFTFAACFTKGGDQPWTAMALLVLESYATMALLEQYFSYHHKGAKKTQCGS